MVGVSTPPKRIIGSSVTTTSVFLIICSPDTSKSPNINNLLSLWSQKTLLLFCVPLNTTSPSKLIVEFAIIFKLFPSLLISSVVAKFSFWLAGILTSCDVVILVQFISPTISTFTVGFVFPIPRFPTLSIIILSLPAV